MRLLDAQHEADFKQHLDMFEGHISWPYLDTEGNVTVGVGCMVPSLWIFESLKWDGGIGTVSLQSEWDYLRASPPGKPASFYRESTTLRLPDNEIMALRDKMIDTTESDVIMAITGVTALPQEARQCVIDMAWNLGTGKLHADFFEPGCKFGPALMRGDWQEAAKECIRRGIQKSRNDYTQALLMAIRPVEVTT